MLSVLLKFFAPGEKTPVGDTPLSLSHAGPDWPWALLLFVLLLPLVIWSYRKTTRPLSFRVRLGLISLRLLILALLLVILVRPILVLPLEESVRRPFLVLLDLSQSMGLVDQREAAEDLARAALAQGRLDPKGGLAQSLLTVATRDLQKTSRAKILEAVAENERLDLWPRLHRQADLLFFGLGDHLTELGKLGMSTDQPLTATESADFFRRLVYDQKTTALGDGLRELLDQKRGQSLAGILLITDGANNSGSAPLEAANLAQQEGVPLFLYGIGVRAPRDIVVTELTAPPVSNVNEKLSVTVHLRATGLIGRKTQVQLRAAGQIVVEEPLDLRADGEQEIELSFTPTAVGSLDLQALVVPLTEEVSATNNTATNRVRILDDKLNVLVIEGTPRWDFQYLLAMLQRDRRMRGQCVLTRGDPDLDMEKDSPFLRAMPSAKGALNKYEIIVLGDVDPGDLGPERLNDLEAWVNKNGGGLIFAAGPEANPSLYLNTVLAPLLPVVPRRDRVESYPAPAPLKLTPLGEVSPLLQLSENPRLNAEIWAGFPGVRWTAAVEKVRPGAQVLLEDSTPAKAMTNGALPVMAWQNYGQGRVLYLGFQETYRWRAHCGETYYTQIWSRIFQTLSTQRTPGSSSLSQLKLDRARYFTGDAVRVSGRLFQPSLEPLTEATVPAAVQVEPAAPDTTPAPAQEVRLEAVPNRPGEYRGQWIADHAGNFSFATQRDPHTTLKFSVAELNRELADSVMNERLLRSMAAEAGGRFLREENLYELPDWVATHATTVVSFKKIPLTDSPYLLTVLIVLAGLEWFWRRKLDLK